MKHRTKNTAPAPDSEAPVDERITSYDAVETAIGLAKTTTGGWEQKAKNRRIKPWVGISKHTVAEHGRSTRS
jgi:hypothetical protein